ncbi:unnamed protein product [Nyctereutes procyonoides]|uniref:(raccoon dog) hypothetical protein n=1 Tax=Nyctereutes procyonoides TaxID=34880 RepID=A0A811ZIP7_NYCPR|nr:unnamed protein product [Nyctereutes procyonoides]
MIFSENVGTSRSSSPGLPSWWLQAPGCRAPQGSGSPGLCVQGVSSFMPLLPFLLAEFPQPRPESFWDSWPPGPAKEPGRSPLLRGAIFLARHERRDYNSPFSAGRPDKTWGFWGSPSPAPRCWAGCSHSAGVAAGLEGGGISCPPWSLPPSSLSCAGRGAGLRLDMVFSAAAERCCVILWLRVVCGTLSVWASAGSGRVKPRPGPVASDGSSPRHPLTPGTDRGGR